MSLGISRPALPSASPRPDTSNGFEGRSARSAHGVERRGARPPARLAVSATGRLLRLLPTQRQAVAGAQDARFRSQIEERHRRPSRDAGSRSGQRAEVIRHGSTTRLDTTPPPTTMSGRVPDAQTAAFGIYGSLLSTPRRCWSGTRVSLKRDGGGVKGGVAAGVAGMCRRRASVGALRAAGAASAGACGLGQGPAAASWSRWSLARLCVAIISRHSVRTADLPRR